MKVEIPLFVTIPRKTKADKKLILNLNNYPRWHYRTYNTAKEIFCSEMAKFLEGKKLQPPIELHYKLFKGSSRRSDRMNVGAVIDKFFCDALTHYGCIEDDNDDIIIRHTFENGEIDKDNPRIEVTCRSI